MVKCMKNYFKRITAFLLALCMLCLCACKNADDNTSSVSQTSSQAEIIVDTALDNTTSDLSLDPENTEIGRGNGETVQFQKIETATACANGIDVSKWQGKIDWVAVKSAGIDFAIIRIGYRAENGVVYRDDNADYNIQQAQKAGVLVGVYFFSTATTTAEAREEAAWTCEAVKGYKISYPVVYDCEGFTNQSSRMYSISAEARTDNALVFLDYVKNAGYDAMIYGAKSDFENASCWNISRIEDSYKVWVAHYSQAVYPVKQTPSYSGRYDMWQYTNRGTVSGVNGYCDMVVSYFTADEAVPRDSSATPDTATAPKTEQELLYTDINDSVTAKDVVNLRSGAGTSYDIVATLESGEFVTRTGIGSNGWSRLVYDGQTVYAVTSYLTDEVIEIEKPDVVNGMTFTACSDSVTAKEEVNLRALPTTDSDVVGKLTKGTFLTRTATSDGGWSRLDFGGTAVYAVTSYLTTEMPEINQETDSQDTTVTEHGMTFTLVSLSVTAKEEVNLRDMPTTNDSVVIYTLKNGEYITKTGVCKQTGWARLEWCGQTVYCIDSYLTE